MVERGGLENRCAASPYRGFESHPLRYVPRFLVNVRTTGSRACRARHYRPWTVPSSRSGVPRSRGVLLRRGEWARVEGGLDRPDLAVLDVAPIDGRARGREVIGVDSSEEMLARARAKLPQADLRAGDLAALPVAGGSCAGAVCALALSHLEELAPSVAELARVLRPGGRLVISNPHPFATGVLGWRCSSTTRERAA